MELGLSRTGGNSFLIAEGMLKSNQTINRSRVSVGVEVHLRVSTALHC